MASIFGGFYFGVADAVLTLSRLYHSEEDRRALDRLRATALRTGLALSGIVAASIVALSPLLAEIFIGNESREALLLARQAVRFFAYSLPLYVLVYSFKNYLLGTGRFIPANVYAFLVEYCSLTAGVWVMVRLLGGRGAWIATPVRLAAVLLGTWLFILLRGRGKDFREKSLLLRRDFGMPEGRELWVTVHGREGLAEAVDGALAFCKARCVAPERRDLTARCLEAAGGAMLGNGSGDGRKHSMDIRLTLREEALILRIRDDAPAFDPTPALATAGLADGLSGLRYLRAVSTNNMVLRIP